MAIIAINNKRLQCGKRAKGALGRKGGIIAGTFMEPHPALDRHCAGLSPAQSASPIHLLRKRKLGAGKAEYLAQSPEAKSGSGGILSQIWALARCSDTPALPSRLQKENNSVEGECGCSLRATEQRLRKCSLPVKICLAALLLPQNLL